MRFFALKAQEVLPSAPELITRADRRAVMKECSYNSFFNVLFAGELKIARTRRKVLHLLLICDTIKITGVPYSVEAEIYSLYFQK